MFGRSWVWQQEGTEMDGQEQDGEALLIASKRGEFV